MSWYEAALKEGCNPAWLDGLTASCIYAFDKSVSRTGIFLHPDSEKEDQPAIEWFCKYSIPIWFPYDPLIGKILKFVNGLPSATQLRVLFLESFWEHDHNVSVPSWIHFFEVQMMQIRDKIDQAMQGDIETWNSRSKQNSLHFVYDAPVYEWKENDLDKWVREKLTGRLAERALLDYRSS